MRSFCTIWFLLIFCGIAAAQEGNTSSLLMQAENVLYTEPQESIRIAEYVLEKSDQAPKLLQAAYILTRGFYMEGKYDQALKIGLKFSEEEFKGDTVTKTKLNILLAKILKELEINSLASYYGNRASNLINENSKNDIQSWTEGKIIQYSLIEKEASSTKNSLDHFYKAKNKFKNQKTGAYTFQIGNINLDLAEVYLREFQLDSAQVYISKALRESKKNKAGNYLEMKSLIKYGNFLFLKNTHSEAIDSLNSAMEIAQKFQNLSEQIIISQAIAKNYLALNNIAAFNNYNQMTEQLNDTRGDNENDAVNTAYNIFNNNETQRFDLLQTNSKWLLFVLGGILLMLLLILGYTRLRYKAKINQYQKFIGYLEKRKELVTATPPSKPDTIRTLNVPKEAEDLLLTKLRKFEKSQDFTNKDISLSRLALQFETNTKYLSETVNTHKQKNFNGYINELRINYIIDKLNNDSQYLQYKISYLAEDSGFSSHSVFATVFKSVTGISPTTFITILRDKQESPAA